MSIFNELPDPFPLKNSFKSLPVSYALKTDRSEYYIAIILPIFYIILTGLVAAAITGLFGPWEATPIQIVGVCIIIGAAIYFGRQAYESWQTGITQFDVIIDQTTISVSHNGQTWEKPLGEFEGVGLENWGSHEIDDDKNPVAAIVLAHKEDEKSVPLIIDFGEKAGKKHVAKIANQLGLPVVKLTHSSRLETDLPDGAIVANIGQAFKVNATFWVIIAAGLALMATAVYVLANFGLSPADGGVLKPLSERAMFAGLLGVLAGAVMGGMYFYRAIYVISIQQNGDRIIIKTAATGGGSGHEVDIKNIGDMKHNKGKALIPRLFNIGSHTRVTFTKINTPYVMMKTANPKHRFLIDMQAEFVDEPALRALIRQR